MPEGDTIAANAAMLRPILVGHRVISVGGTAPSVRSNSHRLLDAEVLSIRTFGKNLVMDFSTGYSIRVHLEMTGRWHKGERPAARLTLRTSQGTVSCVNAPTIEVGRTPRVERALSHLGPDLLGQFDETEFIRRARALGPMPMGRLLLDQRVVAGIGNVYKSELLFLFGVNPWTASEALEDEALVAIVRRARALLAENVGKRRSTTGSALRGQETWVYGQAGLGCRQCGTKIEAARLDDRITYWCPECQPRIGLPGPGSRT